MVGVLNTLQVKTRHAASASLRIRQDGEDLFEGDIPPNAEIGIVPLTPLATPISLQALKRGPAFAERLRDMMKRPGGSP